MSVLNEPLGISCSNALDQRSATFSIRRAEVGRCEWVAGEIFFYACSSPRVRVWVRVRVRVRVMVGLTWGSLGLLDMNE